MSPYQKNSLPSRTQPIKCLTPTEVDSLLSYLTSHVPTYSPRSNGPRNRLLVMLMLDAGLRVGELVQLTPLDLWIDATPVHALLLRAEITKTQKERYIPLTGRIQKAIIAVHDHYWFDDWGSKTNWCFRGRDQNYHMTTRQVQHILRQISSKAIGRTVHPHMLRHTFATRLMRTTSAPVVQTLLGHANLTSTQIYTHPSQSDLSEAIMNLGD